MSLLDDIGVSEDRPVLATITGEGGIGKTTLAATFPRPLVLKIEDGLSSFKKEDRPPSYPKEGEIESSQQLFDILLTLYQETHSYKTLIFDSITQLDIVFQNEIVRADDKNPKSINQADGGYGNGWQAVAALHQKVREKAGKLNKHRGMNIVFIAHSAIKKLNPPDSDPYTKYELRLDKASMANYTDNLDLVGFLKLDTKIRDVKRDKKTQDIISPGKGVDASDNRILVVRTCTSHISKNRFGITKDLTYTLGTNPLVPYIKGLQQ